MAQKDCFFGAVRRRTVICCRSTKISASSVARDRIDNHPTNKPAKVPHYTTASTDSRSTAKPDKVCDRDTSQYLKYSRSQETVVGDRVRSALRGRCGSRNPVFLNSTQRKIGSVLGIAPCSVELCEASVAVNDV